MAATYSINVGSTTQTTFLGNLDPDLMLNQIPNNTGQLIVPEDVRDAIYTQWENTVFKQVTVATSSSVEYIGIGGDVSTDNYLSGGTANGLKILIGKPLLSGVNIMSKKLIEYNSSDSTYPDGDIILYNFKPDDFGGGGLDQQHTKVQFLAGDNSNGSFLTAPYILAQSNVGATAIDLTIFNENGKLTIDSDDELIIGSTNTKVTLLYGTGSTGIATLPGGLPGDIQYNIDNCDFGGIHGGSASLGDVLIMGTGNGAYWGSLAVNSVFTLNQVLTAGNQTGGTDIFISDVNDSLYIGGTGSTTSRIYWNGTKTIIEATTGTVSINVETLKIELPTLTGTADQYLKTIAGGNAVWGTVSSAVPGGSPTNIQFHNSSGSFDGSPTLKWDDQGMFINSPTVFPSGTTYSLNIKTTNDGGLFLDIATTSYGMLVRDGNDTNVFQIDSSGKQITFDESNEYNFLFGGAGSFGKYTFINGTPSDAKHMAFKAYTGLEEFRMFYNTGSDDVRSAIIHSPKDLGGMFIGVANEAQQALYIGDHTGNLDDNFEASIIVYPQNTGTGTYSLITKKFIDGGGSKSVVIGNGDVGTQSYGATISIPDTRALGINITPEVDLHVYGVEATTPHQKSFELYGGSYNTINNIVTSYITLDTPDDATKTLSRIGGATGSQTTTFGTTLRIWNRTGDEIYIDHLSTYLAAYGGAGYSALRMNNIYLSQMGKNNPENPSTYIWEDETEMTFIYLPTNSDVMDFSGGVEPLDDEEGGMWYGQSYETYDSQHVNPLNL